MAAVNWFCLLLLLAFAFINGHVCIKVDTNIPSANENYNTTTTISLNSQTTILPYKVIDDNEPDNITLLGDTELSASERTRRLIPYMAFYVPVSELPINKQYATNSHNNNNIHITKQQQQQAFLRPGSIATGPTTSSHIPIPPQYVQTSGLQYLPAAGPTHSAIGEQNYQTNAGLDFYYTNNGGGGGGGHTQSSAQYHLLPPTTTGHTQHLQPPGPPGPSALGLPAGPVVNKANGNNAFLTFKQFKGAPIRHKTVQHFPPLSSTDSTASSASAASLPIIKQQQQHKSHGVGAATAAGVYRPRTKQQSKINLTPFTPANSVPGNFVPIVYTPLSTNNNNNNNNNLHTPISIVKGIVSAIDGNDDTSSLIFNHNENQQQQQQQPYRKQQQIEYSSGPLPPTAPAISVLQSSPVHSQRHHSLPPLSPASVDLTHDVGASNGGVTGRVVAQHPHAHHQYHNTPAIRPSSPKYIDYLIDEPKQSLEDDHHQNTIQPPRNNQHPHQRLQPQNNQIELLKPTLGPPTHAFILVTTTAPPYPQDPVTQENYGSSLRPPYKVKPKIRLQSVAKENNVNYPVNRQQNPTRRPQVFDITPTPKTAISIHHQEEDLSPKYVYIKEEFGQKIPTRTQGAGVKLKPSNKYESDDNQIPQQRQHIPLHLPIPPTPPPLQPQPPSPPPSKTISADPNELPDIRTSSLAEILHKLQESNHLPHTLTPDNIDNSIKTLIRILNNLKQTQTIVANPPQHHETPAHHANPSSPDYDYNTDSEEEEQQKQHQQQPQDVHILTPTGPNKHPGPSTGRPGIDYPNYAEIPETSFDCSQQRYKGFFGDPETNCQVWHYCDLNGGKASFLCPNGTIFSQIALTCDWWFNVKCATTPQLYVLNERLYKYILPFTPKFPEDYSGPIVDKYLAMKFQEMEEKMRLEKEKALREESKAATEQNQQENATVTESNNEDNRLDETTTTEDNVQRQIKSDPTITPPVNHNSVNSQVSEQSSERNLLIDDEVDDISQRGKADDFESTTIATMTATSKSNTAAAAISFSLKPIIVSSTLEPDYDEENLQHHDNKRSNDGDNNITETTLTKTESETQQLDDINEKFKISSSSSSGSSSTEIPPQTNKMQITVEKVDVIEIKPDGATGHLIRNMLSNSKQN